MTRTDSGRRTEERPGINGAESGEITDPVNLADIQINSEASRRSRAAESGAHSEERPQEESLSPHRARLHRSVQRGYLCGSFVMFAL